MKLHEKMKAITDKFIGIATEKDIYYSFELLKCFTMVKWNTTISKIKNIQLRNTIETSGIINQIF